MDQLLNDRLLYTPKDYQVITGFSIEKCREELDKIRQDNGLSKEDFLTVFHVSKTTKIPVEELLRRMPKKISR